MIKILLIFTILCISGCLAQNTCKFNDYGKFTPSTSFKEYLTLLPMNMLKSFKYSLHTIEFKDKSSNILMRDFLSELEEDPTKIYEDLIMLKKSIADIINNFLEKNINDELTKNEYVSDLIYSYNKTATNIKIFCRNDFINCGNKLSSSVLKSRHFQIIEYLIKDIQTEINGYFNKYNLIKMYFEPTYYKIILIILENYSNFNNGIKKGPSYKKLKNELLNTVESVFDDINENIGSEKILLSKFVNNFGESNLFDSLIELSGFFNNVLIDEK